MKKQQWMFLALVALSTVGRAQDVARVDRVQLAQFAKRVGGHAGALRQLRSSDSTITAAMRTAIRDTLVAITLSSEPELPGLTKLDAIATLLTASRGSRPQTLATARLFQMIERTTPDFGIQGAATSAIARLEDTTVAIQMLTEIAASTHPSASIAVSYLTGSMGEAGMNAVRQLYNAKTVTDPRAAQAIHAWAVFYKWN